MRVGLPIGRMRGNWTVLNYIQYKAWYIILIVQPRHQWTAFMLSERGSALENGITGATFMNENSVTREESPTDDFRDEQNSH